MRREERKCKITRSNHNSIEARNPKQVQDVHAALQGPMPEGREMPDREREREGGVWKVAHCLLHRWPRSTMSVHLNGQQETLSHTGTSHIGCSPCLCFSFSLSVSLSLSLSLFVSLCLSLCVCLSSVTANGVGYDAIDVTLYPSCTISVNFRVRIRSPLTFL